MLSPLNSKCHSLINLEIGNVSGDLSSVNWNSGYKFLKIEIDETGGSSYTELGVVQLLLVLYALYANLESNLGDENVYSPATDTLFVVKDSDGNVVFAVFPDGAAVYVNEGAKRKVGGFAVSGRTSSKDGEPETEYLRVTTDSTIIFIDNDPAKGKVGGFSVSGRSPSKGTADYFNVLGDAIVIINPSEPRVVWFPRKEAFWAGRVLIEHHDSVGFNILQI